MKAAQLNDIGDPAKVVSCAEVEDPGDPGPGEVVIEILACPINPADLLMIEGKYAATPEPPARLGIEGAGRIAAVGPGVEGLAVGDLVMSLDRTNWVQKVRVTAEQAIKAPPGTDVQQLAMLKANPATAWLMLKRYVELAPGDWVIQNAANSGVGTYLIRLAKSWGLKTVNVVRRDELVAPLKDIGADVVLVDGDDLAERVSAATGGAEIKLAIDAVAGAATRRLAGCLADDATVVNYGLLSGEPCQITADQAIFHGITLTGFWLAKLMRRTPFDQLQAMYGELIEGIASGALRVEIEAAYPIERISEALAHAGREGRGGKVQILPNGAV